MYLARKKQDGRSNPTTWPTTFGNSVNTGNVLSKEEALQLLYDWVPNEKLQLHMKQVAAVMKAWALEKEHLSEEEAHKWWLAGLLHDADWEKPQPNIAV